MSKRGGKRSRQKGGRPAGGQPERSLQGGLAFNGQVPVQEVNIADPDGSSRVVLSRVSTKSVADRLYPGSIDHGSYQAAQRFGEDFTKAHLAGMYRTFSVGGAGSRVPGPLSAAEAVIQARRRVRGVLDMLGIGATTRASSVMWHVVGEEMSIADWASMVRRNSSVLMNEQKAIGLLVAALERASIYYGFTQAHELRDREYRRGFRGALEDVVKRLRDRAKSASGDGQQFAEAFAGELEMRLRHVREFE